MPTATCLFTITAAAALLTNACIAQPTPTAEATPSDTATVSIEGRIIQAGSAETPIALENVLVCVLDHPELDCGVSRADGTFAFSRIPASGAYITLEKEGYASEVVDVTNRGASAGSLHLAMMAGGMATVVARSAGRDLDLTAGGILFLADSEGGADIRPLEGATLSLNVGSGVGPVYEKEGLPDPTMHATGRSGWGAVVNMAPGSVEATFAAPGRTCGVMRGGVWVSDLATSVRVLPSFITVVDLVCLEGGAAQP